MFISNGDMDAAQFEALSTSDVASLFGLPTHREQDSEISGVRMLTPTILLVSPLNAHVRHRLRSLFFPSLSPFRDSSSRPRARSRAPTSQLCFLRWRALFALQEYVEQITQTLKATATILRSHGLSSLGDFILRSTTASEASPSPRPLIQALTHVFPAFRDSVVVAGKGKIEWEEGKGGGDESIWRVCVCMCVCDPQS
jgi:hypothetical protein